MADPTSREQVEPFLTSETFDICFDLIYNLQFYLRLFFQLLFNSAVLGFEIDAGLPLSFAVVFVILISLQWLLRKPLATAFLHNQRMTNRMRARTYNAWDNIFSGNRYNFARWHRDSASACTMRWSRRSGRSWRARAGARSAGSSRC